MISTQNDPVKQQVAAHWNRRAAYFDEDFGHSIRTPAERAAWDRILDLMLPAANPLEALDIGCGTGFLSLELAAPAANYHSQSVTALQGANRG
jgi:2-polyprenyl-3-methyl-5-hydroxy-6-metoxy-1,4-benzoquinol methylase